jgi:hypothetical protein
VHTLELRRDVDQRAALSELSDLRLRGLRGLDEAIAVELLAGRPRPHLRELGVMIEDIGGYVTDDLACTAVPALEHLMLVTQRGPLDLNRWPHSPVAAQVRRVTVRCGHDWRMGGCFHHFANYFARAEELTCDLQQAWRFVATREGPGPFRRVRVEPRDQPRLASLAWALTALPSFVDEVVITGVDDYENEELAELLARAPGVVRTGA